MQIRDESQSYIICHEMDEFAVLIGNTPCERINRCLFPPTSLRGLREASPDYVESL